MRMALAYFVVRNSSSSELSALEISGFNVVNVHDLCSVPYLCFTNLGRSGWMRVSQVRTIKFSIVGESPSSSWISWPLCVIILFSGGYLQ